jgi:hypothetical protein
MILMNENKDKFSYIKEKPQKVFQVDCKKVKVFNDFVLIDKDLLMDILWDGRLYDFWKKVK